MKEVSSLESLFDVEVSDKLKEIVSKVQSKVREQKE
jgi:hypothetical protein